MAGLGRHDEKGKGGGSAPSGELWAVESGGGGLYCWRWRESVAKLVTNPALTLKLVSIPQNDTILCLFFSFSVKERWFCPGGNGNSFPGISLSDPRVHVSAHVESRLRPLLILGMCTCTLHICCYYDASVL